MFHPKLWPGMALVELIFHLPCHDTCNRRTSRTSHHHPRLSHQWQHIDTTSQVQETTPPRKTQRPKHHQRSSISGQGFHLEISRATDGVAPKVVPQRGKWRQRTPSPWHLPRATPSYRTENVLQPGMSSHDQRIWNGVQGHQTTSVQRRRQPMSLCVPVQPRPACVDQVLWAPDQPTCVVDLAPQPLCHHRD
jgi:hypothetical protein